MRELLRERLEEREARKIDRESHAAVLVPIVSTPEGPELLLTRRTESVGTHRGQVAFPGGNAEPGDGSPEVTALREAEEEIGLPRASVELLGRLDAFPTVTNRTAVTPVVGWVEALPPLTPQDDEVARIFSIPFARLREAKGWRSQMVEHEGRTYPLYFFDWDGEVLWGLSAYITLALLDLTPEGAPFELPQARIR
ncbi:MAG: CoA pyrophosphatase [Deltaproteobacteria bacterium]|nr:CoA pyrophosphatase [Deltaproteobacteria bacterium]